MKIPRQRKRPACLGAAVARHGLAALVLLCAGCTLPLVSPKPHTFPQALAAALSVCGSEACHAGHSVDSDKAVKKAEQGQGTKSPPAGGDQEKRPAQGQPKDKNKEEKEDKDRSKEEPEKKSEDWYSAHAQATMVTQVHDSFRSPYVGAHSLLPVEPSATSLTSTLFLDTRLWEWGSYTGELVFNPEIAGGRGFSGVAGIAGFPNGEITRVGVPEPTPYIARLFLRQTWGLDGPWEWVEDAPNQVAGHRDLSRITLSVGKLSATDVADDNRYSHDPRTQFLNWSLMYNGAWDYPANVRGYTYGVALELNTILWAARYGIFAEPKFANGAPLDPNFLKANGQILELEERWCLHRHPGKLRQWVFLNHAHMGDYREALEAMPVNPDITLTRAYRFKYGLGLSLEQEVTRGLGVFARLGWNDGHTESWAFTEIDRTVAVGLLLKGTCWCRPNDQVGLAGVVNGLAAQHRDYLAAGGLGFLLGDGQLRYGPEEILELYYNFEVRKGINVTADFQEVNHPAYNRDRGPVAVSTLRVHVEF